MKKKEPDGIPDDIIDRRHIEKLKGQKEMMMMETLFGEDSPAMSSPSVVLAGALMHAYGPDYSKEKFDLFQELLLKGLSRLSTSGENDHIFGYDFDEFFTSYVKCLNKCGQMYKILKDHGIDFDFHDGEGI